LVGASMPAVLVEVAFITNPDEEKQLTTDAYQVRVASAITRGLNRYFQHLGHEAQAPGPRKSETAAER
jgi:N-acetylmuramoyl-L-alanine amidase